MKTRVRRPFQIALLLTSLACLSPCPVGAREGDGSGGAARTQWPAGTEVLEFENIEGLILLTGALRGPSGVDTSGTLVLDTGAGYLALDLGLSRILGLADSGQVAESVDLAEHPLSRLTLGGWGIDHLDPVLTIDGDVVRRVSDRAVLGLLGYAPLAERAVWIDYREQLLALIPAVAVAGDEPRTTPDAAGDPAPERAARAASLERSRALLGVVLSRRAVAVPFRLVGDGKILVRGAVSDPSPPDYSRRLNLIVDTGATKCVLFEEALAASIRYAHRWPTLRGLVAPTLIGGASARIARVPVLEVEGARTRLRETDVDVGIIHSDLSRVLSEATGETIHGLIGYSFLKRFRVGVDYPNRVLWLDPIPGYRDDRPLEYCHVGLQLERRAGAAMVLGVVEDSPAARAGIGPGDELVEVDGASARELDLLDLARRMEGAPGRPITLVVRRNAVERTLRLVRRRLL